MEDNNQKGKKVKGIRASFHNNKIDIEANFTIDREKAVLFLLLFLIFLLVLASTLGEETRKLLLSLLLSALQHTVLISEK